MALTNLIYLLIALSGAQLLTILFMGKKLKDIEYKVDLAKAAGQNDELAYRLDIIEQTIKDGQKE